MIPAGFLILARTWPWIAFATLVASITALTLELIWSH